jgi:hypothetical protein
MSDTESATASVRVALRYRLSALKRQYDSGLYLLFVQNSF